MNKRIRTKSGEVGWQGRLQAQYTCFEEFFDYDAARGLARRLGFSNALAAWEANPMIEGSTNPDDYRKVGA